jgi:hypothetical protein
MLTVHLRVNDAASGKPTPVRLAITGPDGAVYMPLGRSTDFPSGRGEFVGGHLKHDRTRWVYVDGSCEVKLPAGVPLRVRIVKGPEYVPLDQTMTLGPGQMALRFAVGRWSDVRQDGWFPGDTRCHLIPPHAALLEAAAEDLDVVNVLAAQQTLPSLDGTAYPLAPDLLAYSGQAAALEKDARLVAVNTLNVHPALGKIGLLHTHRPVFPLTFGGDDDTDDWSVCDWCDQGHRKGGLAVWVEPFRQGVGLVGGEALVALVLGKTDAIEADADPRTPGFLPWLYRVWNAGFPVPLVGGSGKDCNKVLLGSPRTYARLPAGEPLTYKGWVEAVRAGRTYATTGPQLTFEVNGRGPGDTVDAGGPPLTIRATAVSLTPFERMDVVANGEVIASTPAAGGERWAATAEVPYSPVESGWVAARCLTVAAPRGTNTAFAAHTSPVVIRVAGAPLPRRPVAVRALGEAVRQTIDWVEQVGRFANTRSKKHLLDLCDEALRRLGRAEGDE